MSATISRTIPHQDLRLPDGRRLRYDRPWRQASMLDGAAYLTSNGMRVIASIDVSQRSGKALLHVSASYRNRDPSWAELTALKALFFGPDIDAMLPLPKDKDFVHGVPGWEDSHVFHLWQTPTDWEIQ